MEKNDSEPKVVQFFFTALEAKPLRLDRSSMDTLISIPGDSSQCSTNESSMSSGCRTSSTASSSDASCTDVSCFPALPPSLPTTRDYKRMISFVVLYLVLVLLVVVGAWVFRDSDSAQRIKRLVLCTMCVLEALGRVILASWWLRAASPKLALVFAEVDVLTLALMALMRFVVPSDFMRTFQFQLTDEPSLSTELVGSIFAGAAFKEFGKMLCYLIPLFVGQIRCVSHLLFTAAIAGALGVLYSDIMWIDPNESSGQQIAMGLLYTMMYTLWTSTGCTILCYILQKRISVLFAPFVLLVPILLHAGYLLAIAGQGFGGVWAAIVIAYWIGSGIVLKLLLSPILPMRRLFKSNQISEDVKPDIVGLTV